MFTEQAKNRQHVTAERKDPNLFNEVLQIEDHGPKDEDDDDDDEEDTDDDLTDVGITGSEPDLDADTPPLDENDLEENDLTVEEADNIEWEDDTDDDDDETDYSK